MAFAPAKFIREVRSEISKVVWPSRREVIVSSIMVIILSALIALFLFIVDSIISYGISFVI